MGHQRIEQARERGTSWIAKRPLVRPAQQGIGEDHGPPAGPYPIIERNQFPRSQ